MVASQSCHVSHWQARETAFWYLMGRQFYTKVVVHIYSRNCITLQCTPRLSHSEKEPPKKRYFFVLHKAATWKVDLITQVAATAPQTQNSMCTVTVQHIAQNQQLTKVQHMAWGKWSQLLALMQNGHILRMCITGPPKKQKYSSIVSVLKSSCTKSYNVQE